MNVLDYIIIGVLLISALAGFKKGFINSIIAFVGTLLVIILAFYLKNPISIFLYEHLPFFSLGGKFAGINAISILIYEGLSFMITIVILSAIVGVIVKVTGVFGKIVDASIILTLPSKILGTICGFIEGYIVAFILIFILSLLPSTSLVNDSKYANNIMTKTPILSSITEKTFNSVTEIYDIVTNYEHNKDKEAANIESLNVLLKYEILSVDSADKLLEKGKIDFNGAKDVIDKYRKES